MYPLNRNRRLRSKESLRNLVRESSIHPHDFIAPVFVIEGSNLKEEILQYLYYYNEERPHQSLNGLAPNKFNKNCLRIS